MVGAARVDANLPRTSTVIAKFLVQMLDKKLFELVDESQRGVRHPQWHHSMADIKIYKSYYTFMRSCSPFPRYYHFTFLTLIIHVKVVQFNIRNDAIR